MGFAGDAPWALGVMWFLTALVFFFLLLRVYTRIVCLASYGIDDHVYVVAFIFLLIFTVFIHVSANYGFGQTMEQIGDAERIVKATLYECIGQGFAIVGMAIAKASLGFFLLRLVTKLWHKIAIWSVMAFTAAAAIAQVLCFWLSCVPLEFVYDRRIPGGHCPIDTRPTSYILCTSTIIADFFFAIFPWIIVWNLQMPKRDKYTIAGSMSLGLIAGAAGIKRMTEVEGLYTPNYLKDSVGLIVWSAAEMAITLICIGIPVCRPLYRRIYRRFRPENSTAGYQKQDGHDSSSVALRTIGGGVIGGDGKAVPKSKTTSTTDKETDDISFRDVKLGVNGPFTQTTVGRGGRRHSLADNTSDEEILGDEYRQSQAQNARDIDDARGNKQGIMVTESYRVERS